MELEQKPERSSQPDESSYHGPEHATLYLDYTIAHIKIDNNKLAYPRERGPMGGASYIWPRLGDGPIFEVSVSHLVRERAPR